MAALVYHCFDILFHLLFTFASSFGPDCPFEILGEETIFNGKWMGVKSVSFIDPKTKEKGVWQCAYRNTRPTDARVDGVVAIPILKKGDQSYFVLVKQYRIPVKGWSLEFPAGLTDKAGEPLETVAVRELKEETGYTAKRVLRNATKGKQSLDPGLVDDSISYVVLEVDGDAAENQNPKQDLQEGEVIEVKVVKCDELLQRLEEFSEQGIYVEALVESFALGYALAKGL